MAKTMTGLVPGGGTGTATSKVPGDRKRARWNFAADANYVTGGYPIAPADVGFAFQIDFLDILNESISAFCGSWNRATQKMQVLSFATGAEVNNGTDVHTYNCDLVAEGY